MKTTINTIQQYIMKQAFLKPLACLILLFFASAHKIEASASSASNFLYRMVGGMSRHRVFNQQTLYRNGVFVSNSNVVQNSKFSSQEQETIESQSAPQQNVTDLTGIRTDVLFEAIKDYKYDAAEDAKNNIIGKHLNAPDDNNTLNATLQEHGAGYDKEMAQTEACDNKSKDENSESADDILKQNNICLLNPPVESEIGQSKLNEEDEEISQVVDREKLEAMELQEKLKKEQSTVSLLKEAIDLRKENEENRKELERIKQRKNNLKKQALEIDSNEDKQALEIDNNEDKQPLTASVVVGYLLLSAIPITIFVYLVYAIHTIYTISKHLVEFIKKA